MYKKYQQGDSIGEEKTSIISEILGYFKGMPAGTAGSGQASGMTGTGGMNIAGSGITAASDIISLFGPNADKKNQSKNIGSAIGSTADTVAMAFGIPTGGMGRMLGSTVGSLFDKDKKYNTFTPSGNTAGYWRSYSSGGYSKYALGANISASERTFSANGIMLPNRTKIPLEEQYTPYTLNTPTVITPGYKVGGLTSAKAREILRDGTANGKPLTDKQKKFFGAVAGGKLQEGGEAKDMIEIEGNEFVYNKQGVDDQSFQMLDSTGKTNVSPYGFLAKGKKHGKGNEGGIKVNAAEAYIASDHLGINGKKSGKGNPSVASLMIKNGGKVLAEGSTNKWDKFGINKWNPGAVKHHTNLMDEVTLKAELGKIKQNLEQQGYYKNGGYIVSADARLAPEQAPNVAKMINSVNFK